jgi:hypothetical protein
MKLAKNPEVMRILDFLFDMEAAETFQYSTMQALHRDSPYFHTFPESLFLGSGPHFKTLTPTLVRFPMCPAAIESRLIRRRFTMTKSPRGKSPTRPVCRPSAFTNPE